MSKFTTKITARHQTFIETQKIFFVSTAPNSGRINLSPKGMDSFKVINEKEERYENRNIFQQTFKSENPERRISKGFLHFTNETKKPEKKPTTINIEEMGAFGAYFYLLYYRGL